MKEFRAQLSGEEAARALAQYVASKYGIQPTGPNTAEILIIQGPERDRNGCTALQHVRVEITAGEGAELIRHQ